MKSELNPRTDEIVFRFDMNEAIVLFECLDRIINDENYEKLFDNAERPLIWHLINCFESKMTHTFHPRYTYFISKAKRDLIHRYGSEDGE